MKPEGQRLRVLVRVPLSAMRDVEFPLRGPGFLDLAAPTRSCATRRCCGSPADLELYEGGHAARPRRARARARVAAVRSIVRVVRRRRWRTSSGPALSTETDIPWDQAMLDVLFEYPIASDRSDFSIRPALARLGLRVVTVLRFLPPGGTVRAFEFTGDPGLVRLDPRWHQAALRFVRLGFVHILDGTDHLLFLFCLVIPFRRLRALVLIVTAFTAGTSITLIAAALRSRRTGCGFRRWSRR